jgi:hypothetical protein
MFETAGKIVAGLILLAASNKEKSESRHNHRHSHRRQRFEREPARPGNAVPSAVIGGVMIALGFLLLMVMIGPGLIVNMGMALTMCVAPLAVVALIVLTAIRKSQESSSTTGAAPLSEPQAAEPRAAEPRASEARTATSSPTTRTANPFRAPEREKPLHPPAYYRERAAAYRNRIQTLIRNRRKGPLADTMAGILPRFERWEERVTQLSNRLANFESDKIIQRDIREAPQNITRLQRQMEKETDPDVRQQMAKTLEGYQEQQVQLDALVRLMRRTRLQLDDSIASMGTIYSQVQMLDAMDLDGERAAHIADEIEEEVGRLNDLLSAFGDVNDTNTDSLSEIARRIRLGRSQTGS